MHIDSALRGVAEEDRCPGWKTGKCEAAVEEETVEPQRKTGFCPDCGLPLMEEDDETIASMLVEHMKNAHNK